jgi:superfamily II DNA or RNA helicase
VLSKNNIQSEALELYKTVDSVGFEFATGVGKSLAAILCIEYELQKNKTPWYILCEETHHINNWVKEFKDHNKDHLLEYVTIFCYQSLKKYENTEANLVLDEAHVTTLLRLSHLKTIKCKKLIVLSATINLEVKQLLNTWKDIIYFQVSLSESIDNKILPEPVMYKVEIELCNSFKNCVYLKYLGYRSSKYNKEYNCDIASLQTMEKSLPKNSVIKVRCTAAQKYALLCRDIAILKEEYSNSKNPKVLNELKLVGSDRKKFLAEYKTEYVKTILNKYVKDKRLICFCGSIAQANILGDDCAIHSQNKLSQKVLKRFNNLEISKIFTVKMLRSGVNLENIQVGIITQLDNKSLTFTQMFGRVLRSKSPELYVLVVKDTVDEFFYQNCLEGFNTNYCKVLNM